MASGGVRLAAADVAALPESRTVCSVCARQLSKYGCPRCNMRTCSLDCYKAHSPRCTEEFARDSTLDAMKGLRVDDEQRRRMVETLQRFHAQAGSESSDGGCEGDEASEEEDDAPAGGLSDASLLRLAERDELRLEDLTAEEQRAFLRAVGSGSLSHLLPPWEPWWLRADAAVALRADGTRAVASLEPESSAEDTDGVPAPPPAPLPPLRALLPGEPSPLLRAHAADVLAAYCVALRAYNGDWSGDAAGAAELLLALSTTLAAAAAVQGQRQAAAVPDTPRAALCGVAERAAAPGLLAASGAAHAAAAAADVTQMLAAGRAPVLCALAHAQRLFLAAASDAVAQPKGAGMPRGALLRAERKLYFLQAWANELDADAVDQVRLRCEREAARQAAERAAAAAATTGDARAAQPPQQPQRARIVELP